MRVHLKFDPLTLRSIATGEVPDSRKSALFTDVLHGLGRRTAVLALALQAFFRVAPRRPGRLTMRPQRLRSWERVWASTTSRSQSMIYRRRSHYSEISLDSTPTHGGGLQKGWRTAPLKCWWHR